jgi:CubicO group peptidase (beta-lactamase class C family)
MSEPPPISGVGAERVPRAIEVIERGRQRGLHAGVQLCVRRRGELIVDVAVGTSPDGRPFNPDTLLPWLSAGKPITALAIERLVLRRGKGKLDETVLDRPVASWIPEFAVNGKESITLGNLLTHQAGMAAVATGWPQARWEEIIARVCQAEILAAFKIGVDAAYDPNRSWFILGEILQRTTGRPVSDLLRSEICKPFDMRDSWLMMSPQEHEAYGDRIGAVAARDPEGQARATHGHTLAYLSAPSPGSSWRGPAHDLALFYDQLRQADDVEIMTRPRRVGIFDRTFQHVVDYGLGVIVDSNRYGKETIPYGFGRHCSTRAFGHGGAQSSIGFADPEYELAVAAVANGLPGDAQHNRRFRDLNSAIYVDLGLAGDD